LAYLLGPKVSGARQNPAAIVDNAKALGLLFARLAGSRDAHKATPRTLVVFVSAYQRHVYSDINMLVDYFSLKIRALRGCFEDFLAY
jgi:hypothetical protein